MDRNSICIAENLNLEKVEKGLKNKEISLINLLVDPKTDFSEDYLDKVNKIIEESKTSKQICLTFSHNLENKFQLQKFCLYRLLQV